MWALSITVFPAHLGYVTNTGESSKLHRKTEKYVWGIVAKESPDLSLETDFYSNKENLPLYVEIPYFYRCREKLK